MVRTFIAIPTTSQLQSCAEAVMARLSTPAVSVKWVEPYQMHLTLRFLGEVEDTSIPEVCRVVTESVAGFVSFSARCGGVGAFPDPRRPRTIWMGVCEGQDQLCRLQGAIDDRLRASGYPKEGRRFHPHLTLGRVRRGGRGLRELGARIEQEAATEGGLLPVRKVLVLSSELRPEGPVYSPLARVPLADPGSP
jgi:2'-5' RNA ligase